ncbi:MAG: MFS transporter, partial [Oscillospiraceae bacterium]|nr:MFS transporter [Oscillospiraceae bacterium]
EMRSIKFNLIPNFKPIISSPILITVMLVSCSIHASNATAVPLLPLFIKDLALSASQVPTFVGSSTGIVLGVGAAFTALAAALVGRFSSRIGYWKTLFYFLFAGAIMTIPQAFVSNIFQLTVLRAMSSFFIGGTIPVINALIAISSEKEHQGTIYGVNASVNSVGGALGPMIGSAVAIGSNRAVFLAAALILGLSAWNVKRRTPQAS